MNKQQTYNKNSTTIQKYNREKRMMRSEGGGGRKQAEKEKSKARTRNLQPHPIDYSTRIG